MWRLNRMLDLSPRKLLRDSLFQLLRKISETDDAKAMAARTLQGLLQPRPDIGRPGSQLPEEELPYAELSATGRSGHGPTRKDVVFISARFRTGSTLLWNIFRSLEGITSYYEPLNERQWFSPAARGTRTDPTHKNVDDYWREYDGLEELGKWYRLDWIDRNLFMDASFWDPALRRYIEILIERAAGRPVLQFNRVDFRLPWLRKSFPAARIVHLFRHPRDQWCSTLLDPRAFPVSRGMDEYRPHDHFYLRNWANDLKYQFPFLEETSTEHPYRMFYCIWRLSYAFGKRYSHFSLSFEDLITETRGTLGALFKFLGIEVSDWSRIESIVARPQLGKWREYAPDARFREYEEACEQLLRDFQAGASLAQ